MKNLIYQVYVGKKSKLYDHCIASVKAYADRIGADHVVLKQPKLWIRPDPFTSNRSKECQARALPLPIYEKENAFEYLDSYDNIAIIDGDVYVREDAPSIFEAFNDAKTFGAVNERDMPVTPEYGAKIANYSRMQYESFGEKLMGPRNKLGWEFMNMGVMVFNKKLKPYLKGNTPEQFINRPEFKPFVDGLGTWKWSTDQTLLNWWIRKERMDLDRMDWKWNGLYTGIHPEALKECYFVHFFLKDKLPDRGENVKELMNVVGK